MRPPYATLFGVLLLLLARPSAAQWSTQSPIPTDLGIRGVEAPTVQRVFVATEDDSFDDSGALFESADGGATWVQRDVPFDGFDPFNGIFFLDDQHGWVYGNENYRTTDGGTTWEPMTFLGSTYFMRFYTVSFGYASTNGDNWVSRDGGLSWEVAPNGMFAFDFADDLIGLGVSADGLYRTSDGGTTFSLVRAGDADAVAFLSATVAVGIVDGAFVRSTDGGQTWTTGASAEDRSALEVVSSDVVLAWGRSGFFPNDDGRLLRSADGGQTWTDLGDVIGEGTLSFAVPDAQTVVAVDVDGDVYRSADAGATWAQVFSSPGPRPSAFGVIVPTFPDAQTGYLGYGSGYVIKTTDGGATWNQISSGYGVALYDVDRFDDGRLIAVGEVGTLLTNTGAPGAPWILHESLTGPFGLSLVAVDVIGTQAVVVADAEGRVYRSADGGQTWTAGTATPAGLDAADLDFSTPLDGWVAGSGFSGGAVFHTADGGSSWTPVEDFAGSYTAVDFEGVSGWAANVSGRYYRTPDGGATWIEGDLPSNGAISVNDMDFFDANVGYAVGRFGYAARSVDGGATWEILTTPDEEAQLTDLFLVGQNELWVSTADDHAYYSADGGVSWAPLEIGSEGFGSFYAVTATTDGDAWTVGWGGYIEHFAGPPPPPDNLPPEASFTSVEEGLTVHFTDTSTDLDGTVVGWLWDFDDGTTSTEQHPSHTFPAPDTYVVTLTVTDDDGATGVGGDIIAVNTGPGGTFGDFTEVTPNEPYFITPDDEDFWVATTAPADYDGDGDLDVAVLGYYVVYNESVEYLLLLFRNDGQLAEDEWDFTYVEVPLGDLTTGASDLAWGDVDNDGDEDLVVGSDGATVLYRNDAGTLVLTDTALPGYYEDNDQADFDLRSITWADYDNDGDLDLLLPSAFDADLFDYRTALLRNDGDNGSGGWTFTETDSTFAPTRHAQSAWADYDGDEDLDLLLVNLAPLTDGDGFIRRYRNDGGGTFVGEDLLDGLTVEHGEAQWGDYDGDGDLDLLIAGHVRYPDETFDVVLRVYRNDAETYTPVDVIACPACEGWFDLNAGTWADYDSDGDVDILLAGTYNSGSQIDGRAKIYANDGGVFTDTGNDLPAPRALGFVGGTFSWLDLDGEGDLDYFIAGEYFVPGGNGLVEVQMHAYRNDATGENAAPTAPSGLTTTVEAPLQGGGGSTVTFSWNGATDDSTPAAALTYDFALFPDGPPDVDPRRLPEPGSISAVTDWVVAGLPEGTYRWTVRAVDNAYAGGPRAEGTFTIGTPTAAEGPGDLPRVYAFDGNYPNPFREATTLRYALPEQARVDLAVYDVLGRLVTRLVSDTRPAGFHEVRWEASGLASGTYLVRFSTDAFTTTRRVLLLK